MVDIRDFFGNTGKKPTPKKNAGAQAKKEEEKAKPVKREVAEVINLDDDDEEPVRPAKRVKKEAPTGSKFTPSKPSTSTSRPKPQAVIDEIDDDDDDDFKMEDDNDDDDFGGDDMDDDDEFLQELDSLPEIKSSVTGRASRSKSPKPTPSPKKQSPKNVSPAKKTPMKEFVVPDSVKTHSGISAADILAKIPDCPLPEDIPTGEGSGFNFRDFKARQSTLPTTHGNIEIPEGAPNCLTGLTVVFTGVLPNLPREDCEAMAKKYGAKVTKSISSKTSLVVLGEEAGPSKVKKIKQHKIKCIDETGFLQLIRGMPEEGGDGDAAEKARTKRLKEEHQAMEESMQMEAEAEAEAKKRDEAIKKAQKEGRLSNSAALKTDADKLWTTRYAPTKLEQLCGNKSTVQKLQQWLEEWPRKFGNRKPQKGDTEMRAVLISGPPGIGKTTAAHLVANSLGYDIIEKNASDVRSQKLLKSNIGGILNNSSVMGYFQHNETTSSNNNKFCIIMDEVDGMSGGDRGGAGELAAFCRKTQAPMILICNDKSLPKMRVFDRCTLDLPFRRPAAREMKSRLMTIALREKIKLDPNIIDQLVAATNNDIRQIINLLSTVSTTEKVIDSNNSKGISNDWQKNVALKIFDIIPRLLSGQIYLENSPVPLYKKMEMYFDDHAFVPLMMQENYLNTRPSNGVSKLAHLELVAKAADSISEGDLVDAKIHSAEQQWSLMPLHAIMSSVRPGSFVAGALTGRVNFAGWLGQNSKTGKYYRLLTELQYRSRLRTSTSAKEFRLEYIPTMAKRLLKPLLEKGADGITEVIEMLDEYYLSKTDFDFLMEFPIGTENTTAVIKKIPTAVKSKLTRQYNKMNHPVSILRAGLSTAITKGNKKDKPDNDDVVEDDEEVDDDDE